MTVSETAEGTGWSLGPTGPHPRLGPDGGLPTECAANMDNLRVVPKAYLVERQCSLGPQRMSEACEALRAAVDC